MSNKKVIDLIEESDVFPPKYLFAMAKELGISKICGIESSNEFSVAFRDRKLDFGFDTKAEAVISAYIAKFGLEKEVLL